MSVTLPKIEESLPANYALLPHQTNQEIVKSINNILEFSGFTTRIDENEKFKVVYNPINQMLIFRSSSNVSVFYKSKEKGGLGLTFSDFHPDGETRILTVDLSDEAQQALDDLAENYYDRIIIQSTIRKNNVHYDKFVNGNKQTFVVYGEHEFLSPTEYILFQESIVRGEIVDKQFYDNVYDVHEETCDDCGSISGYVNTGEVNDDGIAIYEPVLIFEVLGV